VALAWDSRKSAVVRHHLPVPVWPLLSSLALAVAFFAGALLAAVFAAVFFPAAFFEMLVKVDFFVVITFSVFSELAACVARFRPT
jgi:hypothetical protein